MSSRFRQFFAAMSLAGLIFAAVEPASAENTTVKLLGTSATVEAYHGFLYLGNPLGFYKTLGVDVEFAPVAGDNAGLQLLGANSAQMAYVGMDTFILAKAKHPELPIIAVYLQDRGNIYEVAIPDGSDIKNISDLKGKTIGVANLASGAIPVLKSMLAAGGLDPNTSVGLVPVGNGAQAAAALQAHRVDALALFRAQHALLETMGWNFRYLTKDQPSAVIVANTAFLKGHRQAVVAVLKGIVMDSVFAEANPERAVREHWKLFGKPTGLSDTDAMKRSVHVLEGTSKMWKDYRDSSTKWGDMTEAQWDARQQLLIDQKLLDNKVPSSNLFTDEFVTDINTVDAEKVVNLAHQN